MRIHKPIASIAVVLVTVAIGDAGEVSRIRWSELQEQSQLESGEVVSSTGENATAELLIENKTGLPLTSRLVTLESPGISNHQYTLRGQVRYEGVTQPGYFEMWNHFPDGSSYFTRTAAGSGPMSVISGSSSKRDFILPFQSDPQTGSPQRLEINLVLPGDGRVWIGPITVVEFTSAEWPAAMTASGAWWSPRQAGLVGGILGSVIGIMGAIIGTLCSVGRARTFCVGLCWFNIVVGSVCLIAGIVAMSLGQPYEVYYPLLLGGVITTVVLGGLIRTVRKRYEEAELRRMASMDASVAS